MMGKRPYDEPVMKIIYLEKKDVVTDSNNLTEPVTPFGVKGADSAF